MKNKFFFFISVCLFININYYNIKAEEFSFESSFIEITNNGNIIEAKDGVKVSTKNNIEIIAKESTYDKIKLVLAGSITLIISQALIHLGVNIRLFPTTGMTLPFLSYGGSSIVGASILSGIILNLTKRKVS